MKTWQTVGLWGVCGYIIDVLIRPHNLAKAAREAADARGKPLLNVGAGTGESSLRAWLLGPTLWGDVNIDLTGSGPHGPDNVSFGDAMDLSEFPDGYFGAAIASHVFEHVDDPSIAYAELLRVTDGPVYIITPKLIWMHTWTHPGHQWYVTEDGEYLPLWR